MIIHAKRVPDRTSVWKESWLKIAAAVIIVTAAYFETKARDFFLQLSVVHINPQFLNREFGPIELK